MHTKRLLVAAILLPLFYLYITGLPAVYFFALLLIVSLIAQWEFYSMYHISGPLKNAGIFLGVFVLLMTYLSKDLFADVLVLSLLIIASVRLLSKRDPRSSLQDISISMLPVIYIPGLLAFQLFLRQSGPGWILFLFGCVWIADSFAFYLGKSLGKRKLYAEVSPNKTVVGACGSLIGGSLSGWLLNLLFVHTMTLWKSVVIGFVIGAITIIGDLVESMFKRNAGVKDSGGIIPGHGGILDKIDGVLFAGPVLYWVSFGLGFIK